MQYSSNRATGRDVRIRVTTLDKGSYNAVLRKRTPNAQVNLYPWKDTKDKIPLAVRHVCTFLRADRPAAAARQPLGAAAQ
jgi:hypothetical protein